MNVEGRGRVTDLQNYHEVHLIGKFFKVIYMWILRFDRLHEGGSGKIFYDESRDGEIEDFIGFKSTKSMRN